MKERIIYNNYDLWEDCAIDVINYLKSEYPEKEITNTEIWEQIYFEDEENWNDEFLKLKEYFATNDYYLLVGTIGTWNGKHAAGTMFYNYEFETIFYNILKDCLYWKIWDENGHFYIKCSHHDGTNIFEIKKLSDKGYNFIDNWSFDPKDKRTEQEIHNIIWKNNSLSGLLHYAFNVYGCKKYEK